MTPNMMAHPGVSTANDNSSTPAFSILVGIPGSEDAHIWISIPFCLMYIVALLGNSLLIFTEQSLHEPMYVFLCMLAVADLLLSSSSVPKTLSIFWSISKEISFEGCLAQMFTIHLVFVAASGILLATASDRYVAICNPLRYTAIRTRSVTGKTGAAAVVRSFCLIFPAIPISKQLPYCGHNVMPHTYCERMGLARLACADIRVNIWLGVVIIFLSVGLDTIFTGVSYALILRTIARLPSKGAHMKVLNTCGSHIFVIFMFYTPAYFSFLTHRFGHQVPKHLLILLANLYVVIPPTLNPIVYGVKMKQIRESVIQMSVNSHPQSCARTFTETLPALEMGLNRISGLKPNAAGSARERGHMV